MTQALIGQSMATREAYGQTLLELGEEREDFIILDADIASSCKTAPFHKRFPARAFNIGIAEQNMMATAAGLSSTGFTVFVSTYAVFASMRACEQVRTFIAHTNQDVKIAASHGGLQVSSDGATHQALEDIAIMRSMANMTVVQPADGYTMGLAVRAIANYKGPCYLRMTRNALPPLFDTDYDWQLGKAGVVRQSHKDAVTIVATGLMVSKALEAADQLAADGISARVLDIHTIKPLDEEAIIRAARETGCVVTAEDHTIYGGLGSAVAEVLVEHAPVPMKRIGLRDVYGESGDPEELFIKYGMGVPHIVEAAHGVVRRRDQGQSDYGTAS